MDAWPVDFVFGLKSVYGFHAPKIEKFFWEIFESVDQQYQRPLRCGAVSNTPRTMANVKVMLPKTGEFTRSKDGQYALLAPHMEASKTAEGIELTIHNDGKMIIQPAAVVEAAIAAAK